VVGDSKRVLLDFVEEGAEFELVYVDGSHAGLDVMVDAALSWQVLTPGGFVVFDDYTWAVLGADPLLRPGPAIDAFLRLVDGKHEVVLRGSQLGLRKTSA
jgi:predicted O-methyltransferase YrrM